MRRDSSHACTSLDSQPTEFGPSFIGVGKSPRSRRRWRVVREILSESHTSRVRRSRADCVIKMSFIDKGRRKPLLLAGNIASSAFNTGEFADLRRLNSSLSTPALHTRLTSGLFLHLLYIIPELVRKETLTHIMWCFDSRLLVSALDHRRPNVATLESCGVTKAEIRRPSPSNACRFSLS